MRFSILLFAAGSLLAQPYQCSSLGEQRLLGIIVNNATSQAAAREAFFGGTGSLDHFYRDSSYNRAWFTGDVVNVAIQLPTTCDPFTVKARADAAMTASGVNLDLYTRRLYIGGVSSCGWQGSVEAFFCNRVTEGGTKYATAYLNGLGAWNHEMGHLLGMPHAAAYNPFMEYGDPTDTMGSGGGRAINAPHRLQMGWIDAPQEITASGTYLISPLEAATLNPQVLRIQRSDGEGYYLSYRQPVGPYDAGLYSKLTAGVSVHVWSPNNDTGMHSTRLLDTTPGSAEWFLDAPLSDGATYSDLANGVTITQLTHTPEFATVTVTFGAAPPPPPPPPAPPPGVPVTIAPASATLSRGQSVQFTANQPVAWSLSGLGSISSSGRYYAPKGKIKRTTIATVTATSSANGTNKATATVTLKQESFK
jgi:hypothetical protein